MTTIVQINHSYYECSADIAAGLIKLFSSGELREVRRISSWPETFQRPLVATPLEIGVLVGKRIENELPPQPDPVPQIEHTLEGEIV